ncbi:hypothetical protein D1825_13435 [Cellulomonas rhizosphaerae]|uniref:Uncharacterized protein n=1 Tax=Cellulomonas rhizosphaerae TaxID=2293719 RepID=A0A413RJJ8_9CELL|nr:hypothetical protein D1825_13435 [Cellulomonas rhizosphaerae]
MQVTFTDPHDAARVVDALLEQADHIEVNTPMLARRYRAIADDIGDALDRDLPKPGPGQTP